jgi:hypothetical protein
MLCQIDKRYSRRSFDVAADIRPESKLMVSTKPLNYLLRIKRNFLIPRGFYGF